jgi:hypothetical protein
VTQILDRVHQGDSKAAQELLPRVYEKLRKLAVRMANEKAGQTLQPTVLVDEAWLKIAGDGRHNLMNRLVTKATLKFEKPAWAFG